MYFITVFILLMALFCVTEIVEEKKENFLQKISLKVFIIKLLIVVIDHPHGLMSVLFFVMFVPMNF